MLARGIDEAKALRKLRATHAVVGERQTMNSGTRRKTQ